MVQVETGEEQGATTLVKAPEYCRPGTILAGPVEEAKKSLQGRRMVRERVQAMGKDSIFNLTGLVRTFPLDPEDLPGLENQFTFYAYFMGEAEKLAIKHMGGHPNHHGAVICNRVTSSMLAIMLALVGRGDRVLSIVGKGRPRPSVQQAVELVGATFEEVAGMDALEEAIPRGPWKMLALHPLRHPSTTCPPLMCVGPSAWPRKPICWCSPMTLI